MISPATVFPYLTCGNCDLKGFPPVNKASRARDETLAPPHWGLDSILDHYKNDFMMTPSRVNLSTLPDGGIFDRFLHCGTFFL